MADYSAGKIYKLYITGFEEVCYIGSTITPLEYRLALHRSQANNPNQPKTAASVLFEECNEVICDIVEAFPCDNKRQLEERERYWIEQYDDCINKNIPTRGWKERWVKNREHNLNKHKEWVEKNKDHIKEYNDTNKERRKELEKARYDSGYKEKRAAAKKERVKCPVCEKEMAKSSLWEHTKKIHPK